ncbi:MAG TPA: VOC family protein [Bryobacteraceae bacterium]|nr:VOC family protein [Bryobacteraceae bacterium]
MLASAKVVAFLATGDAARAKAFYGEVLGLRLLSEDAFAVVFDANGTTLRVAIVQDVVPAPYTVLGWDVEDIADTARRLTAAGVDFERYAWLQQDDLGIWSAPGGSKVAWFKDLDGNVLSVSQH